MQSNNGSSKQQVPYSLLAELYRSWEEYGIPAVFYQYTLAILPKMDKKRQMLLMSKQIKTLKSNTHIYHRIINSIEARERSLSIIIDNLPILFRYQSTTEMQWPDYSSKQLDFGGKYRIIHEDQQAGLQSPRRKQSDRKRALTQLINHIRMYQRVSIQLTYLIIQWQQQLLDNGYKQSVIQFQYHKQDYLLTMIKNTTPILEEYSELFENNLFFIMKKVHEKTQYGLIYAELKPPQEIGVKIYECLNLLSDHQAKILKFRMLAKVSQTANKYRRISKSTDIHKLYSNLNHGNDYIVIKDSNMPKKSRIIPDPPIPNKMLLKQEQRDHRIQKVYSSKTKNDIIINPQFKPGTDKTIRKYPVLLNSDFMGIANEANQAVGHYLSSPVLAPLKKNQTKQPFNKINLSIQNTPELKRSKTHDHIAIQQNSDILDKSNIFRSQRLSQDSLLDSVSVRFSHGKKLTNIASNRNQMLNDQNRNKGYVIQRKLEVMDQLDKQKLYQQSNLPELTKDQNLKKIKLFEGSPSKQILRESQVMEQRAQQNVEGELSENSQLTLVFEEGIKHTEIVKHLRNKVFNNSQTHQNTVDFEQIQGIAKKILVDKDYITFIRVEAKRMRIAWLAVKFLQRDTLTMKRAVMIVYIRKFLKLTNFQHKLLDTFVAQGYGVIRNQNKILYEINILDIVSQPLVKIKYKVSVTSDKQSIKNTIKSNKSLSNSRLLKYYYYSKNSKYHKYCDHTHPNICSISFNFKNVFKICIDRVNYVVGRADKITSLDGEEMFRVHSIVNDGIDCIVSKTLTSILALEKEDQIDRDSSFDSKMETQYRSIAIREAKIMRKYVESVDGSSNQKKYKFQQTVVSQFITVNNKIAQVRSIMKTKQEALKQKILVVEPPFFMAIAAVDEGETKTIAILQFQ